MGHKRPRPPITAREIGAYLAGGRAAKACRYALLTPVELERLAYDYAEEDSPIFHSMGPKSYCYWFNRGYCDNARLAHPCP